MRYDKNIKHGIEIYKEVKKIREAKKNGGLYISPMVVSPNRIEELFIQALKDVLEENKNNEEV